MKQTVLSETQDFTMRGEGMTRIETFVAAAFAFAVTMLVISVGSIPTTFAELFYAVKLIPSFAASFSCIVWIWHAHASWCRRYGLEDGKAIFLSCLLVFLVLIYIYPLRIMMQGLFSALSGGFLPFDLSLSSVSQVRFMYIFYSLGFLLLSLTFVSLYAYAQAKKQLLQLNPAEQFDTLSDILLWAATACVTLLALILALVLPDQQIGYSAYIYFLIGPLLTGLGIYRGRKKKRIHYN
jgi:uncharacterized membrane protein